MCTGRHWSQTAGCCEYCLFVAPKPLSCLCPPLTHITVGLLAEDIIEEIMYNFDVKFQPLIHSKYIGIFRSITILWVMESFQIKIIPRYKRLSESDGLWRWSRPSASSRERTTCDKKTQLFCVIKLELFSSNKISYKRMHQQTRYLVWSEIDIYQESIHRLNKIHSRHMTQKTLAGLLV